MNITFWLLPKSDLNTSAGTQQYLA